MIHELRLLLCTLCLRLIIWIAPKDLEGLIIIRGIHNLVTKMLKESNMKFLSPIEAEITFALDISSKEAEELEKIFNNGDRTTILSEFGFPGEYIVVKQEVWLTGYVKPNIAVTFTLKLIEL